jgi:hypothetical protein
MLKAWQMRAAAGIALAACVTTSAAEHAEVMGAFGFEFGQAVDAAGLHPLGIEPKGGVRYGFIPENPYVSLTEYELMLTPRSLRVYRITARGTFKSMERCREELVQLEKALERKYVKTSGRIKKDFGEIAEIRFGTSARTIRGVCTGAILKKTLTLTYTDEDLLQAAQDEAAAAEGDAAQGAETGGMGRDESGL